MQSEEFADVLAANADYAEQFSIAGLDPVAAQGLAVVTCMDSRIEPLEMLGLKPGDAKIMRNAGARVTSDVLRTLALATHVLGVNRIMVVAHTRCMMASTTVDELTATIKDKTGIDVRSLNFQLISDQRTALASDVQRIRSWPFLPSGVPVGGFVYDVDTGRLTQLA